jgi:Holliday junction DNA helicase RuvA
LIGHLHGRLLRKQPQQALIDVGGVGYRVHTPLSTFYRLGVLGQDVALSIHTHVRDDAIQLFGFATDDELALFERLIAVSGVGPRLALSILSGIDVVDLIAALRNSDIARLTRVPGVGKRTAERLVLELRDKMAGFVPATEEPAPPSASLKDDVVSALANLGYSRADAERALSRALRQAPEANFEDLLRVTLQVASGA